MRSKCITIAYFKNDKGALFGWYENFLTMSPGACKGKNGVKKHKDIKAINCSLQKPNNVRQVTHVIVFF